ncbi:MAG: HAD-IC family P-type ATPase, partial [Chitinophagales bacterium]
MNYYMENADGVVESLNSNIKNGLDDKAIELSKNKYGNNSLKATNSRSFLKILLGQFTSPLIIILIVAALFSYYLGQIRDGSILFAIIVSNALIGFYQEWKSENIIASLKKLVVNKCNVKRNGQTVEIFAEDLVPGDLVQLHEGEGVPADLRLIESNGFSTNEFILTGESLPANKDHLFNTDKALIIAEIKNCVFMGTTVAKGEAKGIVYATGMQTEIGKISTTSQKIKATDAPVQTEIADIAKKLSYATLVIGLLLFGTRLLLNDSIAVALVFAVSVAAAMVPEGLPAQISVALALAVSRLSKKNAIVKKLSAAQTLGSATVIASDKTGTITKNQMTITGCHFNDILYSISGLGYAPEGVITDQKNSNLNKDTLGEMKAFFLSGYLSSTGKINPPDKYHASWY